MMVKKFFNRFSREFKIEVLWALALFLVCWVALSFLHLKLIANLSDDTYIHFRIASHLAESGQPYFNLGEKVMGSSSSGWTILLAAVFKLVGVKIKVIALMNALFTTLGILVYAGILRRLTQIKWNSPVYLLYILSFVALTISASVNLMETPLALLLVGIGIYLSQRKSPYAYIFLTAAVFVRLELVFFYGLFFLKDVYFKNISIWKIGWVSFFSALPFVFYDLYFFGSFIPQTATAKSIVYNIPLADAFESLLTTLFNYSFNQRLGGLFVLLFLTLFLFPINQLWMRVKKSRDIHLADPDLTGMLILLAGLCVAGFYVFNRVLIFLWYIPLYLLPIGFGLYYLGLQKKALGILFLPIILVPYMLNLTAVVDHCLFEKPAYIYSDEAARVRKYISIGSVLYQNFPNETLLTVEIGGLGYGFKGKILDGAGLVSPEVLKYHPLKVPEERLNGAVSGIPLGVVNEFKPGLIVSYDIFIKPLLNSDWQKDYILIKEPALLGRDQILSNSDTVWGSPYLYVFIRKDLNAANLSLNAVDAP